MGVHFNQPCQEKSNTIRCWTFSAFGYLEDGFERRLLAICQWHVATAVAFPQKSESVLHHHVKDHICLPDKCGLL